MRRPQSPIRMGIVGAGFSGVALVAAFAAAGLPLHLILIDKAGEFGAGDAYRTSNPHHLLNACVEDMSVYEHDAAHFERWLSTSSLAAPYLLPAIPIAHQYVPRFLYRHYLQSVLSAILQNPTSTVTIECVTADIVSLTSTHLKTREGERIQVDKAVFCLGNAPVPSLPFNVEAGIRTIDNPWDYMAVERVAPTENVTIIGSGLSMIDAVLTLHHNHHQGKITAISRHGLLPLPHIQTRGGAAAHWKPTSADVRQIMRELRNEAKTQEDWRALMGVMRSAMPKLWQQSSLATRKRFLRHVLTYWNIHRHRVHWDLSALLSRLQASGQLEIKRGRIQKITAEHVYYRDKPDNEKLNIKTDCIINCMGPSLFWKPCVFPVLDELIAQGEASLDDLHLGLAVNSDYALIKKNGAVSSQYFALGSLIKGSAWETIAAPEIRKQCVILTEALTDELKKGISA